LNVGRTWAGHNIEKFDCARIKEAFQKIGRQPPEPTCTIDTYPLLEETFGRRAGDMKVIFIFRAASILSNHPFVLS